VSTKTEDKPLAQEIAMKWAQLAQAGRAGRLTESQCRAVIAQMYERAIGQPLPFRTTRAYLLEWLENSKTDTTLSSNRRYQQIIGSFLTHVGVKADRLLREITSNDIRSWRDALRAKGLSVTTTNGSLKILRMPFKAAHDNGLIDLNPLTKTSVKLLKDETRMAKDIFAAEQIAMLLKAAPSEDWQGAILCGYFTGLRLKDVCDLTWSSVDLVEQIITIETRKTRKTVTLPIHPQFGAWLVRQTRGIGKAPVFPSLAGILGSGKTGLSMQFRHIMDKAGIKGRVLREATGAGRPHSSLSYHSLRHSFNAALANAGVGVETRQELTGHSSVTMNKLYTHPDIELKRAAISLLPSIPTKTRAR
jgi:integrase